MAQDRIQWQALVNIAINIPFKAGDFLTLSGTIY
jgi:hypothetical protein